MTIGICGLGYVGKVVADFFNSHYEVIALDPLGKPYPGVEVTTDQKEFAQKKLDLAVICLPTQPMEDGSCDTSLVEEACSWVEAPVILIRSTIPPGTVDRIKRNTGKNIVFSPEMAGEGSYWSPYPFDKDEKQVPFYVFGGDTEDCLKVIDLYVPIAGPTKMYDIATAREAETMKYMENLYFAWKVSFANEVKEACDALGVAYWVVRRLWSHDPRVDKMHTAVFPNSKGFGGKCLPKDTLAYVRWCQENGYEPEGTKGIIRTNMKRREGTGEYPDVTV